ncbi:hypothetical protein HJ590_15205 [Naumannella sp. ID2617S]|nr:hypothetical protein [Naumannella sp. ID2617S]
MRILSRPKAIATWPMLPTATWNSTSDELQYFFPTTVSNRVLWIDARSVRGCLRDLSQELGCLAECLDSGTLSFLGAEDWAWRGQSNNDYPPVVRALCYLKEKGVGPRFKGGLQMERDELVEFIPHLGWLTRCNASFPYVYFTDERQQVLGHVCQHGSLQLSALSPPAEEATKDFLRASRLTETGKAGCYNRWGTTSAIAGRVIDV